MKRLFLSAMIIFVVMLMVGCAAISDDSAGTEPDKFEPLPQEIIDVLTVNPLISLVITEGTVTPTGLQMTIFNDTDMYLQIFDLDFRLEHVVDGRWVAVVPNRARQFTLGASQILPPESSTPYFIHWNFPYAAPPYYGELPYGDYRIVLIFPTQDTPMNAAAEFSVGGITAQIYTDARKREAARFEGVNVEIINVNLPYITFVVQNNNPNYAYNISTDWIWKYYSGEWEMATIHGMVSSGFAVVPPVEDSLVELGQTIEKTITVGLLHNFLQPGRYQLRVIAELHLDADYTEINNILFRGMRQGFYAEFEVE